MSIFRRQGDGHETSATPVAEATPGVVPPPAAPLYSTRPEPAPRVHDDAERSLAEQLGIAREALERSQVSVEGSVRVASERAARATELPAMYDRRRTITHAMGAARAHRPFDPVAAAQAGLLNLAWRWQAAGSPIRAIHTYMQLLARYPHSAAASAAVADLVELSNKLAEQGHFHIALGIYEEMEELDDMCAEG